MTVMLALVALPGSGCLDTPPTPCGAGHCPGGTVCVVKNAESWTCAPRGCGDSVVDDAAGEMCDDGNTVGGDGCSADCRSDETCGNGIVDDVAGEECDCGAGQVMSPSAVCAGRQNTSTGGHCSETCALHCGDGVWGSGPGDVFAVGNYGTLLHYDGMEWQVMPTSTLAALEAVWASGPGDVFAVGNYGTVLHYDGASWQWMPTPTSLASLFAVWGSGPGDVFAVGGDNIGGTVLHYDGASWLPIQSGTSTELTGVWGDSTGEQVFVVAAGGAIHRLHRTARGRRGMTRTAGPDLGLAIPDDGYNGTLAGMACVDIWAPAASLGQVLVELGIDHPRAGDLTIKLESPLGTVTTLLSRPGHAEASDDGQGQGGVAAALSQTAPITFQITGATDAETMGQAGGVICAGDGQCTFAPNPGAGPGAGLHDFRGENASGRWRVCAGDSQPGQAGTIDRVALTFDGRCGNGKFEVYEQCDDGNLAGGDGCNADCRLEQSLCSPSRRVLSAIIRDEMCKHQAP